MLKMLARCLSNRRREFRVVQRICVIIFEDRVLEYDVFDRAAGKERHSGDHHIVRPNRTDGFRREGQIIHLVVSS